MNHLERQQVGVLIANTAQYYGKELRREVISMMISDLDDLPANLILKAYESYRKNPNSKFFPLPAQIREIISPKNSPEAEGREISSRVILAVGKFGWSNSSEAKAFVGEIGWKAVQEFGGWQYICENLGRSLNVGVLSAQIRDRSTDLAKNENATLLQLENKKLEQISINHESHNDSSNEEDRKSLVNSLLNNLNEKLKERTA